MNPSFSTYLVNPPFGDPGLYVEIRWARRALLFDLGDNTALSPTRLLRAMDVFVSHTHMDHFIGFDRLLRIALGRGKTLRLYGPPGLIANIDGKLRGYTWNLANSTPGRSAPPSTAPPRPSSQPRARSKSGPRASRFRSWWIPCSRSPRPP